MATEITYNGSVLASLSAGQSAVLSCANKKAVSDIVANFDVAGSIIYNETETAVEAGKTATLSCAGKKMLSDVVIVVSADSGDTSREAGLYQNGSLVMDWATIKATYPNAFTADGGIVPDSANTSRTSYFTKLTGDLVLSDEITGIEGYAFKNANNITSVFVPASVATIENCAFFASGSLKEVNVSNANDYYKSVDGVLYTKDGTVLMVHPQGRTNTEFVIPDGVTTLAYEAFASSGSLTTITIGKDVKTLRRFAFEYCTALKKVYVPVSVTEILQYAFYKCDNLTNIYYAGTQAQWNQISIETSGNSNLTSASKTYDYSI